MACHLRTSTNLLRSLYPSLTLIYEVSLMNRLKLDWALSTSTERTEFVQDYINSALFSNVPLTQDELETLANYVLWGKNENGLNVDQEGFVELPRKNATWTSQNVESLDELTESPTFNEASLYSLTSKAPTKKVREVFSRTETRKNAPPSLLQAFENLWHEIDMTELTINFYDLLHEKRTKPPRADLLKALSEEDQLLCEEKANSLNQFKYLKLRHLLVELRREQYTMKDSFSERILPRTSEHFQEENSPIFDADIPVFPLGLISKSPKVNLFQPFTDLIPQNFTAADLKTISNFYWSKQNDKKLGSRRIDFTDLETVYELFQMVDELEDENEELFSTTSSLLKTLNYYIDQADLTAAQREILELKINKEKNQDIALHINKKYGKSYTVNYISTIFRQKIIPAINAAALYHEKLVSNLFFVEEFKQCTKCGHHLLRDPINFVRKSRAKDGLSNHCKVCDKKSREEKKEKGGRGNG